MAEQNPILAAAARNGTIPDKVPTEVPTSLDSMTATSERDIVNPVLKEAESYAIRAQRAGEQQRAVISKQQSVLEAASKAAETSAKAAEIITRQKGIADLQTQNNNIDVFEAAGGTDFLVQLAKEQKTAAQEVIKWGKEVDNIYAKEYTGLDIIDAVINDYRSIVERTRLRNAESEVARLSAMSANINSMTESSARSHILTQKSMNESTIAAQQEKIAADSELQLAESRLKILSANADQITAMMNADARVLDARLSAYRIRNDVADRELRLEQHKLAVEAAQRQKADWIEGKEIQANSIEAVQRAQATAGLPVENENAIKAGLSSRSADVYKKYETLFVIGASGNEQIGTTPADSIINMSIVATGGIPNTPEFDILQEINGELRASPIAANIKDEESYKTAINSFAADKAVQYSDKIVTGDSSNWYGAPPMSILKENKAVKESKLYKNVLEPLDLKETDPATIFKNAVAGVQAGTVSVEDAVSGVTTIFKAAGDHNNATKKFKRVGLPEQVSYNTDVQLFDRLFGISSAAATLIAPFGILAGTEEQKKEFQEYRNLLRTGKQRIDLQDESSVREIFIRSLSATGTKNAYSGIGTEGE